VFLLNYNLTYARKGDNEHWYEHVPKSVETSREGKVRVIVLRNQPVQTLRTIPNNKPDIINRDNEEGTCSLIDVAISGDRNVIKTEVEKILNTKTVQQKYSAYGK
jgi:hypothetical protein